METLFDTDEEKKSGYFYLTAHYLVKDYTMGGLKSDGNKVTNKSVGNVSVGYGTSSWVANNDQFGYLATTNYGLKYLSIIQGRIIGKVFTVAGDTNA